jgi:hypothetical protein
MDAEYDNFLRSRAMPSRPPGSPQAGLAAILGKLSHYQALCLLDCALCMVAAGEAGAHDVPYDPMRSGEELDWMEERPRRRRRGRRSTK